MPDRLQVIASMVNGETVREFTEPVVPLARFENMNRLFSDTRSLESEILLSISPYDQMGNFVLRCPRDASVFISRRLLENHSVIFDLRRDIDGLNNRLNRYSSTNSWKSFFYFSLSSGIWAIIWHFGHLLSVIGSIAIGLILMLSFVGLFLLLAIPADR